MFGKWRPFLSWYIRNMTLNALSTSQPNPLGTRRVMNVRWTSYFGPSDVNYWRTPCGRKICTSFKGNFWTLGRRSFFVVTIFERPKDVLIQMFFERWISASFGRVILGMTKDDCWLNVVSKRRLNVRIDVTWTSFFINFMTRKDAI